MFKIPTTISNVSHRCLCVCAVCVRMMNIFVVFTLLYRDHVIIGDRQASTLLAEYTEFLQPYFVSTRTRLLVCGVCRFSNIRHVIEHKHTVCVHKMFVFIIDYILIDHNMNC